MEADSNAIVDEEISDEVLRSSGPDLFSIGENKIVIRVYKRRWLMLALSVIFSISVSSQWAQYTIIAKIVMRYYSISSIAVDSTALIPLLFYVIFIFPVTYSSEKIGLKWTIILGSSLCCIGNWIKMLSVTPDGFLVTLLGQSIVAFALVIVIPMPGQVAANWFASNELSRATSLGLLGQQLGMSISFFLPPMMVKNRAKIEDIGNDLEFMFWWSAIAASVNLVLVGLLFQDDPKLPPSETRALQQDTANESTGGYKKSLRRLFTNESFLLLCNSYGLNVGIQNALGTMFSQLFVIHFKDQEEDAGRIGSLITLIGMLASIMFGTILDKTHKFKETAIVVYLMTVLGYLAFMVSILEEIVWMVYASMTFLGFFMSGYLTIGYELAAEYTYPESETLSAGILNITNSIYGIIFVLIQDTVLEYFGDLYVHVIFCTILIVGFISTVITKDEQRRQDTQKAAINLKNVPPIELNNNTTDDGKSLRDCEFYVVNKATGRIRDEILYGFYEECLNLHFCQAIGNIQKKNLVTPYRHPKSSGFLTVNSLNAVKRRIPITHFLLLKLDDKAQLDKATDLMTKELADDLKSKNKGSLEVPDEGFFLAVANGVVERLGEIKKHESYLYRPENGTAVSRNLSISFIYPVVRLAYKKITVLKWLPAVDEICVDVKNLTFNALISLDVLETKCQTKLIHFNTINSGSSKTYSCTPTIWSDNMVNLYAKNAWNDGVIEHVRKHVEKAVSTYIEKTFGCDSS
ncbi:hypothetical protein QAD02_010020 [Eretmocerus hayati]|uniref:Uncharacterized protein n=1 Tax=Eretmocerus hayati TaxID=131215 RepID=A0ACC2NB00_9HYME|nr:hypothetical protein QAD02_010020 [Eretmocerus hayati]